MRVIYRESRGDPRAYQPYSGAKGLFQLVGYSCNVWPPTTNIRLAHKLWVHRGWQPWGL